MSARYLIYSFATNIPKGIYVFGKLLSGEVKSGRIICLQTNIGEMEFEIVKCGKEKYGEINSFHIVPVVTMDNNYKTNIEDLNKNVILNIKVV